MFIGEYSYSIDHKGRVALPPKFRARLGLGCVVTKGLDNALFLFPHEEWQKLAEKLSNLPLTSSRARAFTRLMLSGAIDLEPDKQGRITIPLYLREFAQLRESVVVAGLYNRVEIWSKSAWEKYQKENEEDSSAIAENLSELGI